MEKDYYQILEIPPHSSDEEVRQGYLKAKNAFSGDSVAMYSLMTKDECDAILEQIELAYSILSIPTKRAEYNKRKNISVNHLETREDIREHKQNHFETQENHSIKDNMGVSRLGATNKFRLSYSINEKFEDEIELCTEFSGEYLKKIREYKNVTIQTMSEWTKVSKTYIRGIEEENYSILPAPAFIRGFVYQYARCLKIPAEKVAKSFMDRMRGKEKEKGIS